MKQLKNGVIERALGVVFERYVEKMKLNFNKQMQVCWLRKIS